MRRHKYGLRDEDASESTPINKMPSYLAMSDLASADARVRKTIVTEKSQSAIEDFSEFVDAVEVMDDSWKEKLDVDRKGNIYATIDNITLIFENDPYFRGRIAYDDFEKCEAAIADLPWRKVTWLTRRLTDRDDANIRLS